MAFSTTNKAVRCASKSDSIFDILDMKVRQVFVCLVKTTFVNNGLGRCLRHLHCRHTHLQSVQQLFCSVAFKGPSSQ